MAEDNYNDEFFEQKDRELNKTRRPCGHLPCTLGHCKACAEHCGKGNEYEIITKTDCK